MCGICGFVWRARSERSRSTAASTVRAMMSVMRHRGPDDDGMLVTDDCAIGHLRLAIIDLENAVQPMSDPSGQVTLAYNGEIYNFPELTTRLKAQGWAFRTRSDTEAMLAHYTLNGADFDSDLNGMYSYAMLDRRGAGDRLQLAVDPVGIKPLYIAETRSALLFASELRGIVAGMGALGVAPELDREAVAQYLALGWVPAPRTLLKDVRKLRPGERLGIDTRTAAVTSLRDRPLPAARPGDLHDTLVASVRRQVISDAPLGFFLSGGIDSSLLVAIASRMGIRPKTFTIRFEGGGHGVAAANEADVARAVAVHFGTEHRECSVTADTLIASLDRTLIAMDQPIADPACLPLLSLAGFARQEVKVALSGDGGDELFAGYPRHWITRWKERWAALPGPLRRLGASATGLLPSSPSTGLAEKLRKARVGMELIGSPLYVGGPFADRHARDLVGRVEMPDWAVNVPYDGDAMLRADVLGQLAGQMLPKTDHITMHASLECRVPFLDLEMIAAARAVPLSEKCRDRVGKLPLREMVARYLPAEIANRPKHGFRVPLTGWFRHEMADEIRERLLDVAEPAGGALSRTAVEKVVNEHVTGAAEHSIRIWSLLALQSWLDRTFDRGIRAAA